MDLLEKLSILSDSAKYDVSCSSSGSAFVNEGSGLGNRVLPGICHSWSADGRCISLLKILFTNICIYDCAYCINRASNDRKRTSFTVDEIVHLVSGFYKRNYIEGLFLSSGIAHSPDYTMKKLSEIVYKLRKEAGFHGYIHVKAIPGAAKSLIFKAGLYADRMSVNIELPSERSLKILAPQKSKQAILTPMGNLNDDIQSIADDTKKQYKVPRFLPAGQTTQLIVGASPENDKQILNLSQSIYKNFGLKRVYYSAYSPLNKDIRLPQISNPPLKREHRLYQADWLLRFYHFTAEEIFDKTGQDLDMDLDPKMSWALRHYSDFPIEINTADFETLLRVPGIGHTSALKILRVRKTKLLDFDDLKKLKIVLKRAQYFVLCNGKALTSLNLEPVELKSKLSENDFHIGQLALFQDLL